MSGALLHKGDSGVDPCHQDFAGGADPGGTRDSTAAFAAADGYAASVGALLAPSPGTYRIAGNATWTAGLLVRRGVRLQPSGAVTIAGPVEAGPYPWIDLSLGGRLGLPGVKRRLPEWYGDDPADDQPALQAALDALKADGGGELYLSRDYLLVRHSTVSLPIPVAGRNFSTTHADQHPHLYLVDPTGIRIIGPGRLVSRLTIGDVHCILLDGPQNCEVRIGGFESVGAFDARHRVRVAGAHAVGITSTRREAHKITLGDYEAVGTYTGVYIFGDPASATRVRGVELDSIRTRGAQYGIACHDNGDDVTWHNIQCQDTNARPLFLYGVSGHAVDLRYEGVGNNIYGPVLIKAYSRDVSNITGTIQSLQATNGGVYQLTFQSQHHVATQPTPARVHDVDLHFNDDANATGGSIDFAYLQDLVYTPTTSANLFDYIRLVGRVRGDIHARVRQADGARGHLDIDDLKPYAGSLTNVFATGGFVRFPRHTWKAQLRFGGSASGMTGTFTGEYTLRGSVLDWTVAVALKAKGTSAGVATIDLPPVPQSPAAASVSLFAGTAENLAGPSGPIVGYVGKSIVLLQETATATVKLTDADFTDASVIRLSGRYPVAR